MNPQTLVQLQETYCICRLASDSPIPDWAIGAFLSITRTPEELSIVCEQANVPDDIRAERDWGALRIKGTLDFSLTGILASIAFPLAGAGISIFAVSTFDTDYVLFKAESKEEAVSVLRAVGHKVE